jgi:hypothetical protein
MGRAPSPSALLPQDGLYYTFNRPARSILKVLQALKQKQSALMRYYTERSGIHFRYYIGGVGAWFFIPQFFYPRGTANQLLIPLSVFGLGVFVLTMSFINMFKQPTDRLLRSLVVGVFKWTAFLALIAVVAVANGGSIFSFFRGVAEVSGLIPVLLAPLKELSLLSFVLLLPLSLVAPGLLALMYYRHRLKRCRIQEYELAFITRILQPLLKEMSPEEKCHVSFNPFHSHWSIDSVQGWDCDALLKLMCRPEAGSRLLLAVTHLRQPRISSRGKHKGYRHRLSYRLSYGHPILAGMNEQERERLRSALQNWVDQVRLAGAPSPSESAEGGSEGFADRWLPLSKATKLSVSVSEEKLSVSIGTKMKMFRKQLEPEDLIRPSAILQILRGMTETIGAWNLEVAPSASEEPPAGGF